jgi:ABC-type amino acid transport substrate-binding protein
LLLFSGCGKAPQTDTGWKYLSFRDISGVTSDEIKAVQELRGRQTGPLVYGMGLSTETFYNHDGGILGFSALLCDWLTDLFAIRFEPTIYNWPQLIEGLESGAVDFTGELNPTEDRRKIYTMTDPIALRLITAYRIEGSEPLSKIAASRKPSYVFPTGTTVNEQVRAVVDYDYEFVEVESYQDGYAALKSGGADAFFMEESMEAAFDIYDDVVAEGF